MMWRFFLTLSFLQLSALSPAWAQKGNLQQGDYGYLYCHMNDRGRAWTAFALSRDGFHYHDLFIGDSVFSDAEHARIEGATRDAYICRKHDGSGYLMVCTDMNVGAKERLGKVATWDNYGIDLLTSDDLISWRSVTFDYRRGPAIFSNPEAESVYKDWSTINRVWAPQIMWDADYVWPDGRKGGYMVYYSMWNRGEEAYDRMYYSYADESFTTLTQPRLLFDWGYATIDADINWVEADPSPPPPLRSQAPGANLWRTIMSVSRVTRSARVSRPSSWQVSRRGSSATSSTRRTRRTTVSVWPTSTCATSILRATSRVSTVPSTDPSSASRRRNMSVWKSGGVTTIDCLRLSLTVSHCL